MWVIHVSVSVNGTCISKGENVGCPEKSCLGGFSLNNLIEVKE